MEELQIDLIRESFSSLVNHPCLIAIFEPSMNDVEFDYQSSYHVSPQSKFNRMKFYDLKHEFNEKIKYLRDLQGKIKFQFDHVFIELKKKSMLYNTYLEDLALGRHDDCRHFESKGLKILNIQDERFNLIFKDLNLKDMESSKKCLSQMELYLNRNQAHFETSIQSLIDQMSKLI